MTAAAPTWPACLASSTASWVEVAPVPATTGTRPAAYFTQSSVSCLRSAMESTVNSPVLPPGTRPCTPACNSRSMWDCRRASSILLPSSVKGVIRATITPVSSWLLILGCLVDNGKLLNLSVYCIGGMVYYIHKSAGTAFPGRLNQLLDIDFLTSYHFRQAQLISGEGIRGSLREPMHHDRPCPCVKIQNGYRFRNDLPVSGGRKVEPN
ncbi:hypothetical protein BDV26DRAFT_274932 [Aspergillus bertholletiae]|uniref:Uncharacterized protein n=1 Tax=Aspergillus bertholletiae TaxID=1226010 RepID=A0A5N7ATD6_9EURO|nr:hypothetical protein BDV26DRAFT_274932 [Aspergillus bertholletiae]